jgi:putative addiction module CopG family antidote
MARSTSLSIVLPPKLQEYVRTEVGSGRYDSPRELIRDSLLALQKRERIEAAFWHGVRRKVAEARDDQAAGRVVDGEATMADILSSLDDESPKPRRRAAKR